MDVKKFAEVSKRNSREIETFVVVICLEFLTFVG